MSSLEIAELTGKRPDNVLADVRKMLKALRKDATEFSGSSQVPGPYGRPLVVFELPKDLTLTLVSGYNVQMRHRIITRWLELEEVNKPAVVVAPRTLSEALFLAATLAAEAEQRREASHSNIVAGSQATARDYGRWTIKRTHQENCREHRLGKEWPIGEPTNVAAAVRVPMRQG